MRKRIAHFRDSENGTVAVIFAIMIVAILILCGVAIDMQRTISNDARLQAALDAAALAGAKTLENADASDADITQVARDSFTANLLTGHKGVSCETARITILREDGRVNAAADCDFDTTFAKLMGIDSVTVSERATARAAITKLDVAFMLDVSGSMRDHGKLDDLKKAAKDAVDILIKDSSGDRVRIALNTYATSMNAGDYAATVLGTEEEADKKKGKKKKTANTCVSERPGDESDTDAAPGKNAWLGDKASECPETSITPLTSHRGTLKSSIAKLKAKKHAQTAGHLGVAWAWYLISPEWKDIWPAASRPLDYDEPNTKKAVVLMTDGKFNKRYDWGLGSSDEQAAALCANMRDAGILIYAVAFEAPGSAKKALENCAGSSSRYFEAENGDELAEAYQAIASQLTNLSLTE